MNLHTLPLFERVKDAQRILLTGVGGGFDIFSGLPLYFALRALGKDVYLGNLSFSLLDHCSGERPTPHVLAVTADTTGHAGYFPEGYLSTWFRDHREEEVTIYAFAKTGVPQLKAAYEAVIKAHDIEVVIGCDGGTDSLMRGDEPQLGTPDEDMLSLAAISGLQGLKDRLLVCLGFGVDTFHGVCHHYFLEAVAELTRTGDFLGSFSCMAPMPEAILYKEATDYVHAHMPHRPSIVNLSIMSALDGDFGDIHRTERTEGSSLYINPLMTLYFAFDLMAVSDRVQYMDMLRHAQSFHEVMFMIRGYRGHISKDIRTWRDMPM